MSSTRALRAYYLASFASIGVFLPFASPWLAAVGVHGFALGWIAATRPLAGIFAPILFGWLADRFGLRGKILRLATFGAFLPFAWLGAATLLGHRPTLLELWLAIGISSFFRVPMMTLADVSALEKTSGYGASRAYGSVGFMVAALLAGTMDIASPSQFPIAVALAFLLAFALSFLFPARVATLKPPTRADALELLRRPGFALLLLVTALWATSHVAYDLCISLHLHALGATPFGTSIGWSIGVIAEIGLMSVWDRYRSLLSLQRWLLFGLIATATRWLALSLAGSLTLVLWLQPLHAFSFAVVWMALMELSRERAPRNLLGTAQGLFSMSCSIGATVGMLAFGSLYGRFGGFATFGVAAFVALLAGAALVAVPFIARYWQAGASESGVAE